MPSKLSLARALAFGIALTSVACSTAPANTGTSRLDDAAMSCTPTPIAYRITALDPSLAAADSLDLDGDAKPDDALGAAHDAVTAAEPSFAIAPRIGARLATDLAWTITVDRCGDDVRFAIARDGDAALVARAVGAPIGGAIFARDGELELPLVALADPSSTLGAGWTFADGVQIRAAVGGDSIAGVFAGALDVGEARAELAPAIAAFFANLPAGDPVRAAAQASDGTITAAAVAASALFDELVTGDVVLRAPDGTPRGDGAPRISFAFAFAASRVP